MKASGASITICILLACFLLGNFAISETRPAPIRAEHLVGAWSGCAQGCTEFYRLDLESNHFGTFVVLSPDLRASLYRVEEWKLEAEELRLKLKALRGAEDLQINATELGRRYFRI